MTKTKITDAELIKDIRLVKKDYKHGVITAGEAKIAIMTEVANYLRGL